MEVSAGLRSSNPRQSQRLQTLGTFGFMFINGRPKNTHIIPGSQPTTYVTSTDRNKNTLSCLRNPKVPTHTLLCNSLCVLDPRSSDMVTKWMNKTWHTRTTNVELRYDVENNEPSKEQNLHIDCFLMMVVHDLFHALYPCHDYAIALMRRVLRTSRSETRPGCDTPRQRA